MEIGADPPDLARLLDKVPFFRGTDRLHLARLAGGMDLVRVAAGTEVVREGDVADSLYLLEQGEVEILIATPGGPTRVGLQAAPGHFGEMGLLLQRRTSTVRAVSDLVLWRLPRARFDELVREQPGFGLAVARAGLERLEDSQRAGVGAPPRGGSRVVDAVPLALVGGRRSARVRGAGAVVAVLLPALLWNASPPAGLSVAAMHVSLLVLAAAVAWSAEVLPDFATGLLLAAALGASGLLPLSLILSGFASSAWLVAVGSFAVAVALARSGFLFRTALWMLRTFPASHRGQLVAIVLGGLLMTPMVPLALARVAALGPLARELSQALGYPARSRAAASLGLASILGNGLFSSVFLSGLVTNFFVISLLGPAERARFDWAGWLLVAGPFGAFLLVAGIAVLVVLFKPEQAPSARRSGLHRQEAILGELSEAEKIALVSTLILLGGVVLQPWSHVDPAWTASVSVAVLAVSGSIDRAIFRSAIDWGFLVLFGTLLGLGPAMHAVGVDAYLSTQLGRGLGALHSPGLVLAIIVPAVVASRLLLPWIPAMVLCSSAFVPAAASLGLSGGLVGLVVLVSATTWLLPRQMDLYRLAAEATRGELLSDRYGLLFGTSISLITLLAVVILIPYWRAIGLVGG